MDERGQVQHTYARWHTILPDMPGKVTTEGVVKLLLKLNSSKASGPDLLPARVLQEMAI